MENYFDKIHEYIDGLLNDEEKHRFEQELAVNPLLAKELELQQHMSKVITRHVHAEEGAERLKKSLDPLGKEYFNDHSGSGKGIKLSRWIIPVTIAASIALLFLIKVVYHGASQQLPKMNAVVTRGATPEKETHNKAVDAFNNENYQLSHSLLESLHQAEPANAEFSYYLGLSSFGQEQYERAAIELKPIADGVSVYKEDAAYFTAYAYSKTGHKEQAVIYAGRVSKKSVYYEKALELIKK